MYNKFYFSPIFCPWPCRSTYFDIKSMKEHRQKFTTVKGNVDYLSAYNGLMSVPLTKQGAEARTGHLFATQQISRLIVKVTCYSSNIHGGQQITTSDKGLYCVARNFSFNFKIRQFYGVFHNSSIIIDFNLRFLVREYLG